MYLSVQCFAVPLLLMRVLLQYSINLRTHRLMIYDEASSALFTACHLKPTAMLKHEFDQNAVKTKCECATGFV